MEALEVAVADERDPVIGWRWQRFAREGRVYARPFRFQSPVTGRMQTPSGWTLEAECPQGGSPPCATPGYCGGCGIHGHLADDPELTLSFHSFKTYGGGLRAFGRFAFFGRVVVDPGGRWVRSQFARPVELWVAGGIRAVLQASEIGKAYGIETHAVSDRDLRDGDVRGSILEAMRKAVPA